MFGMSLAVGAINGSTSCPIAAPIALARLIKAVALTREVAVNHLSL
jgi:hypothetical protein